MKSDRVRLQHMLDAVEKALVFSQNKRREDLESDELLALALVRLLEIIGEAAKQVAAETKAIDPLEAYCRNPRSTDSWLLRC